VETPLPIFIKHGGELMKLKLAAIITSIVAGSLLFAVNQPGEAATYTNADGTVEKYMTRIPPQPLAGHKG